MYPGMEREEQVKWVLSILESNGGAVWKSALVAKAIGHLGLPHTAAYDLINGHVVGAGLAVQVMKNGHATIVLVRQGP